MLCCQHWPIGSHTFLIPLLSYSHSAMFTSYFFSLWFRLLMVWSRVLISFGKYWTELTVISVRLVNFIKIYWTKWFGNFDFQYQFYNLPNWFIQSAIIVVIESSSYFWNYTCYYVFKTLVSFRYFRLKVKEYHKKVVAVEPKD